MTSVFNRTVVGLFRGPHCSRTFGGRHRSWTLREPQCSGTCRGLDCRVTFRGPHFSGTFKGPQCGRTSTVQKKTIKASVMESRLLTLPGFVANLDPVQDIQEGVPNVARNAAS